MTLGTKIMALINCPECNTQVSDTAVSCPSCGYSFKTRINKPLIILALVLGLFGAIVGFTIGNPIFGAIGATAALIGCVRLFA